MLTIIVASSSSAFAFLLAFASSTSSLGRVVSVLAAGVAAAVAAIARRGGGVGGSGSCSVRAPARRADALPGVADGSLVCLLVSMRINNTTDQLLILELELVVAEALGRLLDVAALH